VIWAVRRRNAAHALGGGSLDGLPARGKLGSDVQALIQSGKIQLVAGLAVIALTQTEGGVAVEGQQGDQAVTLPAVDEVIAATGTRPDLQILREIRLDLDPATESPRALAPLIDPNLHSCGSVRPHGADLLQHPESGFYIAGVKSYGRAPTFLLLVGYEQVRSIVATLTGDVEGARSVELTLPETGVCGTACCGDGGALQIQVSSGSQPSSCGCDT
jgi:hypothetical protein